ncbi:hypothetical protein [Nonomuraea sp. NPDC049784]|uniref:hypothetical protein n=1 Tax=Nonomuraea sp. NPDC049784 TaxID=3154361 RepID=UPI003411CA99
MEPDWETFISPRALSVPGRLHVVYQENGGALRLMREEGLPARYRVIDPRTGDILAEGRREPGRPIADEHQAPRVVVFSND